MREEAACHSCRDSRQWKGFTLCISQQTGWRRLNILMHWQILALTASISALTPLTRSDSGGLPGAIILKMSCRRCTELSERRIPLKINSVVLADTSDEEIVELAGLARQYPITLRFIEKMPFSGIARPEKLVNGNLLQRLKRIFPKMEEQSQDSPSTARIFSLPGYKGSLGIIQGYSRLFCSTCNKVRITPTGMLKTCLYDNGVLDLKKMLRQGSRMTGQ